jgi:hypothetical protein
MDTMNQAQVAWFGKWIAEGVRRVSQRDRWLVARNTTAFKQFRVNQYAHIMSFGFYFMALHRMPFLTT